MIETASDVEIKILEDLEFGIPCFGAYNTKGECPQDAVWILFRSCCTRTIFVCEGCRHILVTEPIGSFCLACHACPIPWTHWEPLGM
jgi:hypothetical protein